jgi:hypothetical protein
MNYVCPVCGYSELTRPPERNLICPSCGTEFDYHDHGVSHEELRARWISAGARWFSRAQPPPPGWDPFHQLSEAHLANSAGKAYAEEK